MAKGQFTAQQLLDWFKITDKKEEPKIKRQVPQVPLSLTARRAVLQYEREQAALEEESLSSDYDPYRHDPEFNEAPSSDEDYDEFDELLVEDYYSGTGSGRVLTGHTTIYDKYDLSFNKTRPLPIAEHRERILSAIDSNSVVVIQGSTGSGKSTQVPQYILEEYTQDGRPCNIICTQPRRIAATSLAKFVCECRKWPLGSLVGYQIAMDKVITEDTCLTFVTTGVLVQRLSKVRHMNNYTHVILDEVRAIVVIIVTT